MARKTLIKTEIMRIFVQFSRENQAEVTSTQLRDRIKVSSATLKRHLDELVTAGLLVRTGKVRSTRYRLASLHSATEDVELSGDLAPSEFTFPKSAAGSALLTALGQPLAARRPVTYQRQFVDNYVPNESFLLPRDLAEALLQEGRMRGQQPAATYARKVLEQLLIDLSWWSSRLEGNRYTLLATEELFKRGSNDGNAETIMLLNHKRCIEFLVDAVPEYELNGPQYCFSSHRWHSASR
jgi:hypothetical protein